MAGGRAEHPNEAWRRSSRNDLRSRGNLRDGHQVSLFAGIGVEVGLVSMRLLSVGKCFGFVIETDDVHDLALANGEQLKPEGGSAPVPGSLCTSHAQANEKAIMKNFDVIHTAPDACISTSLIPRQDFVTALACGNFLLRALPMSRRGLGVQRRPPRPPPPWHY